MDNYIPDGTSIQVVDPIIRDTIKKYVCYTVKGVDIRGTFETERRYSDFEALRKALVHRWPACFVPPLPPKKEVGKFDTQFIEDRRNLLDLFCKRISLISHLFYSDEMEIFKRSSQSDIEKAFNNLRKLDIQLIFTKYQQSFNHLEAKERSLELLTKISQFQIYIKRAGSMLDSFKKKLRALQSSNEKYSEQYNILLEYLLPEYEKQCQTEYNNGENEKLVISKSQINIKSFCETLKETKQFDSLLDVIRVEIWDLEAFEEVFAAKDKYEQIRLGVEQKYKELQTELYNIQQGKSTMKQFFSSGDKMQELQMIGKQLESVGREVEQVNLFCEFLSLLISEEIEKFKHEKEDKYYHVMKGMTSVLGIIHERSSCVWNGIRVDVE